MASHSFAWMAGSGADDRQWIFKARSGWPITPFRAADWFDMCGARDKTFLLRRLADKGCVLSAAAKAEIDQFPELFAEWKTQMVQG